jgi:chemotaxis protein methyltransferase CheR
MRGGTPPTKKKQELYIMAIAMAGVYNIDLTDLEFRQFQALIFKIAGISMSASKRQLVSGRLARRVKHYRLNSYGEYYRLLMKPDSMEELQVAVDLLTTNETYFFREPKHFDLLRNIVLPPLKGRQNIRIWSGACSSGEEPYSIAMTLADCVDDQPWEIIASDISSRVLEKARTGHYPMERAEDIPPSLLTRYCLKGVDAQAGTFLVDRSLRSRVRFMQVNLNADLPRLGEFDVIFLRNVLIYFDAETKRQVVQRLLNHLKPGGYFVVSHSETLQGVSDALNSVAPSVYRKS